LETSHKHRHIYSKAADHLGFCRSQESKDLSPRALKPTSSNTLLPYVNILLYTNMLACLIHEYLLIQIIIQWVSGEKLWIEEERLLPPPPLLLLLRIYYKPTSLEWSSLSHVMTLLPAIISTTIINAFFGFYNFGPQLASQKASNPPNLLYQSCGSFVSITIMMYCQMCESVVTVFCQTFLSFSLVFYFLEKRISPFYQNLWWPPFEGRAAFRLVSPSFLVGSHVRKVKSWGLWMVSYTIYFIILNVLIFLSYSV